jgi:hypothetical protein
MTNHLSATHQTPPYNDTNSLSSAPEDEEAHFPMTNGATKINQVSTHQRNPDSELASEQADALTSSLQRTRVADKLKGRAVSRQLVCL